MKTALKELGYFSFLALIQLFSGAANYTAFGLRGYSSFKNVLVSFNTVDLVREYVSLAIILTFLSMLISWQRDANKQKRIKLGRNFASNLKDIGFFRFKPKRKQFKVFLVIFAADIFRYFLVPPHITSYLNLLRRTILWIPITLEEELTFRYGLFKYLRRKKINVIFVYLLSALIFGSGHFYKDGLTTPLMSFVLGTLSGLFYEFAYESSGWSIYVSWALHLFSNSLSVYFR